MQRSMMMARSGGGHAARSGWRSTEKLAAPADGVRGGARAAMSSRAARPVMRWEIPTGATRPVMRWEIPTEGKKAIPSIAVGVLVLVCGLVVPPAAFGTGPSSDGDGALSSSVFGIAAGCLPPPSVPDCDPSKPVTVPHGETMALDPGTYGDVVVEGGGTDPGVRRRRLVDHVGG